MAGADAGEHVLYAQGADLVHIPGGAVRNDAHHPQGLESRHHISAAQAIFVFDLLGQILFDDQHHRLGGGLDRLAQVGEGQAAEAGVGLGVGHRHGVTDGPAQLGVHAPQALVGVPVGLPGVVQAQAQVGVGVGGHHVGDAGGVILLHLLQQLFCH